VIGAVLAAVLAAAPLGYTLVPDEKVIQLAQDQARLEARNKLLEKENADLVTKQDNATFQVLLVALGVGLAVGAAGATLWHPWHP
jgi:hypothetical protein